MSLPLDKTLHLGAGFVAGMAIGGTFSLFEEDKPIGVVILAIAAAGAAGVSKEWWDESHGGTVEMADFWFTVLGGVIAAGVLVLGRLLLGR